MSNQYQARFERAGIGVFAANGTATITIPGPDFFHVWDLDLISVISTSTLVPKLQVYKNSIAPDNFISATIYALQDTDDRPGTQLFSGEQIICAAQGGTVGSSITVKIKGWDTYTSRPNGL